MLHDSGHEFVLTLVDNSPEFYHTVKKKYDWQTVPMIVENDITGNEKFIGGYTDLEEYFSENLQDAETVQENENTADLSE